MNSSYESNTTSNTTSAYSRTEHFDWVVSVAVNLLLIALTSWILISLIHYGVKTKKWCKNQIRNAEKLSGGMIYTSTVFCVAISLIRYITSLIAFNVGFGISEADNRDCERVSDALFAFYCIVIFSVHIFLWLRQRVFYNNAMLNTNYSRTLKFFSTASIILIFIAGIAVILVSGIPYTYPSSPEGCSYLPSDKLLDDLSWIGCGIILVIGQAILIGLFIYPLQKNIDCSCSRIFSLYLKTGADDIAIHSQGTNSSPEQKTEKRKGSPPSQQIATVDSSQLRRNGNSDTHLQNRALKRNISRRSTERVTRIMQRTIIFSVTSVVTDLTMIVVSALTINGTAEQRRLTVTLYDINVFLNLMLVICSFLTYKEMLVSPLKCKKVQEALQTSGTGSN